MYAPSSENYLWAAHSFTGSSRFIGQGYMNSCKHFRHALYVVKQGLGVRQEEETKKDKEKP